MSLLHGTTTLDDLLENIQLRINLLEPIRNISGAISHKSHALLCKELGWIKQRRREQRLVADVTDRGRQHPIDGRINNLNVNKLRLRPETTNQEL